MPPARRTSLTKGPVTVRDINNIPLLRKAFPAIAQGATMAGAAKIREKIAEYGSDPTNFPENAQATLERKDPETRPMHWTGALLNAVETRTDHPDHPKPVNGGQSLTGWYDQPHPLPADDGSVRTMAEVAWFHELGVLGAGGTMTKGYYAFPPREIASPVADRYGDEILRRMADVGLAGILSFNSIPYHGRGMSASQAASFYKAFRNMTS